MSHKYVSNKAVLQDKGFLSKLGSTLAQRSNPDPNLEIKEKTTLEWRKTSQVRRRIKTATGTIPIYAHMTAEEEAAIEAEALLMAGGGPEVSGEAAVAVETAAIQAGVTQQKEEEETRTVTKTMYTVLDNYTPDDIEGLPVVAGQTVELVDKSSPHKRPRLEGDEETAELLDNSAARHKMAIRPKRNHPDPRSRGHEAAPDERWLVKDPESGKQGLVPAASLEFQSEETVTEQVSSLKRSLQHMLMAETLASKKDLFKEIKEFKQRKLTSKLLGPSPEDEARGKRKATIQELIETEEEFVRDLQFVMENYYSLMDKPNTPREVRDHKELIFNNFKFIADFHQSVLIEGVKYHAEVPTMIGRTFLRLERDFDKHAEYCMNEPLAQEFIANNLTVKEFFDDFSQKLGDDKNLQEHLKLPIQRLNDYQLLLKELVKFSVKLDEEAGDLEKSYELMQSIPQRATDSRFISSIEGFKGNLFRLGRLIRHDWFVVKESGQKPRDRYLFLFKARVLITKVKRISEDRSVFILKDIIRLPETSIGSVSDNPKVIEFLHIESLTHPNFPIQAEARTPEIKEAWLQGIKEYVVDTASVEDLLFDDELRVVSQDIDEEDAGVISPVPEVQDFEDLPEDGEAAPVPGNAAKGREPSPPAKRQKAEQGLPKSTPEQVEEQKVLAEQGKVSTAQPGQKATPPTQASQQEEASLEVGSEGSSPPPKKPKITDTTPKDTSKTIVGGPVRKAGYLLDREGDIYCPEVVYKEPTAEDEALVEKWFESDVKETKVQQQIEVKTEETVIKTQQEIVEKDIELKGRDSPQVKAAKDIDTLGKESPPLRPRSSVPFIDDQEEAPQVVPKAEEPVVDIWGDRDTSPPLRISQVKRPGEEETPATVPETPAKEVEVDIWGDRDSSPPLRVGQALNRETESPGVAEIETVSRASDEVTDLFEELVEESKEVGEEQGDIWGERDTSPTARPAIVPESPTVATTFIASEEEKRKVIDKELTQAAQGQGEAAKLEKEKKELQKKEEEEKQRLLKQKEEQEKKDQEEKARKEKEEKEKKEREERENKQKEEQEKLERERKQKEEKEKKEREEKERLEKERKEKEEKERLEKERKEKEEKEKLERERKAKEEKEKKEREEKERKEKEEKEKKEREEKERKEREEKERKAREEKEKLEKEKKEKEEKERKEREERERKEKEEREKKEREERERKAKEEKERLEKERKEKEERERLEKERKEKEQRERQEKERKEKEERERLEKERKEKEEREKKAKEEKEKKEKEEKERKEKEEKERLRKEKEAAEKAKAITSKPVASKPKMDRSDSEGSVEDEFEKMAKDAAKDVAVEEFWSGREDAPEAKKDEAKAPNTAAAPAPAKPAEVKPATTEAKPAESKPATKPELPKLSVPATQPKPQPTKAPLIIPGKMTEPTTPFTPGGTPKPVFTKTLKGEVVEPGESVSFACTVAHPAPYFITWLKDNKPLDDKLADRVQAQDSGDKHNLKVTVDGTTHKLQVMNCRVQDSGIYTAKATDETGASATCSAQLLVQELTEEERARRIAEKSPFFLVRMKKTEVIENTNLSYTIHVKGDPMPEVQFLKDDKEIKEDERVVLHRDQESGHYELLISHVTRADEGTYKAIAKNKFGRSECEALMTVSDEEAIYESLSGKGSLLSKGEKAEFKWFRDGVEYDPSERFNVMFKDDEDTLALVFQNVTPEDAGLYTCVASTSCGKISCSAELTVEGAVNRLMKEPEAPAFKEELVNTQVALGGSAMMEAKIGGYPKPALKWTRNGMDVQIGGRVKLLWEDEESVSLIIKNIEEKDAGLYACTAKNDLGEAMSMAQLNIKAGPKIVRMRKDVSCIVGKDLDYTVEVHGEPPPEVKWLKDGKQMMESNRIKFEKESDTLWTLHIKEMEMGDCACYTVVVANVMGQVSEFFNLETDAAPQINRGLDPETDKKKGYDVILEVRASGSPRPEARWFKDGKELMSDGEKYKMSKEDKFYMLKIRNVERKDKGHYKIDLTNPSGTATSETVLNVRAPPDFITPVKDAYAKEGSKDVKLFVEWEAVPKATVKWFFKDRPLHEDTPGYTIRGTDTTSVLTIHDAVEAFVGAYTFRANNEYGESNSTGRFLLHEAPVITEGITDVEFLEGRMGKLTFKVTGIPPPEIKWTKDGKKWAPDGKNIKLKQEGEDTYVLTFDECSTDHSGHYVASISNVEGTVTTEGTVVVNTPPHIKKSNFKDGKTFIAMHKFLLEVEATAVPEATATWYFNGKELNEEEDRVRFNFDGSKYTLERLGSDPEHSGEYKCVLKNKIDSAEEAGQITVKEKEARVRNPLEDIYVIENTDATLKCQIVGDPIPSIEWLRNGKPLPQSERFQVTEERLSGWHSLTVTGVTEQDRSSFTVKGKNQHGECETSSKLGILVRPQPGELKDATVDYGKDLLLNVAIHAFPPPKMVWTLEGRELVANGHFEYVSDDENEVYGLLIKSAVLEDAGKITYTAENKAGSCSGNCTVKVHTEKPNVVANLEHLMYCLEDDAVFTFRASGLPLPDCTWKKGDKVVKEDDKHVFTFPEPGVYCLTIKDVNMEDYGVVTVVGKSLVGECNSAGKLSQKKLMCEVVEGLDNVTKGAEGEDVTLNVKIRGSPRPVFEWTKDGDVCEASEKIKIEMKKTSYCEATISLTLVDASSIESGQYRLKFSNELNSSSVETALIIRPERRAPKVTRKPTNLEVEEKKLGVFQAKITGFPKPDVKWMKEGRQVYPTDIIDMGVTAEGLYYLEFRSVCPEDVGKYTVFAVNDEGQCEAECSLVVIPPPSKPEFIQSLKASKVINGYPARLEIQLSGYPTPEVQWMKDGKPLQIDGTHYRQIVDPDGTVILQIDKASEADAGEITCIAKNPEGDVSSSARLSVLGFEREEGYPEGPAKFSEGLRNMTYDEGKNVRLPVGIRGGPVPNMKWYKDGQEIKLDDRVFFTYDGDRGYLEIRPCKGSDAGKYKCVIQNDKGSDETECEVSIRKCFEAPFFTSTFPNQAKLPGREVKMSIKVDAVPKPELSWFLNGKPITPDGDRIRVRKDGDGQTLLIKDCTYSDSGSYKVVAKNREGEVEHEANLEVADDVDPTRRAEAPVFLKVMGDQELFEGSNALFKAIVTGRPEPEFKWTKNGGTIIPTNRVIIERDQDNLIRLTIKNITPSDAGVYQLKVWNEHGEKSCQGKLICETLTSKMKRPVGDEYMGFDRVRRSGVPMPLPDKPMISSLSERRATISWMPYLPTPPCTPVTYQLEMLECPEGEWFTYRTGIRGCGVDVTNLNPKSDYRFRVRVENKYGVSEPSPYVTSFRYKLDLPPISYEPKMDSSYEYKGDGPYVPEGFRISRDYKGNYYAAPRFLKLDYDTQYGLKGFNATIKWYAYGYPTPKLRFTKDGQTLTVGPKTRFTSTQEATGEICLYIERMQEEDKGVYECWVKNEHGQSKQRIKLDLADYPRIQQPLEELHLKANTSGKIMCRISGYPSCVVRWYRDWEPITTGFRFRPSYAEPDTYILNITGAQVKDSGLYSVSAANVAGNVHTSCMVHVEEDDLGFFWYGPGGARQVSINSRRGTLEDHYDIGDELGRGTQGVTYHCVEHHTGRNFAAKSMWGKDKLKVWMHMELEMMNLINSCKNIVRLYDAYEGPKNMVLVTEMCGGGELLSSLTQQQYITEYEVCYYIRQILLGLEYMHDRCIAHLGINIGDILLTRPNGREIKIGDLSLARQIRINKVQPLDYGMPEFVAPEVAKGEGVTYAADMWAVGIITYLLLSGTSPFRGENDRETLTKVQKGELNFDMEAFSHVSDEAKDFIAKLLIYKADVRMDVKKALLHPWINLALAEPKVQPKISTDRLRTYYAKFREWYGNASCKRWFRRRPLSSAFTHPSKMVYPPGEVYTPPDSPEREILPEKTDEYDIMHRDYSYELDVIKNESNYQMGPDTYLLQLRDVDFPCRLRSYMKVATERSPAYAMSTRDHDYDYKAIPVVHERRRFTDIMDEEVDDERRSRTSVDKYTAGFIRSRMETCSLDMPQRVKREVTARLALRDEADALRGEHTFGKMPFLREKPESCAITNGQQLTLTCVVSGDPQPVVQWFKNDLVIQESERCIIANTPGKSTLTYEECLDFDTGQYKVVARNQLGQVLHRFRLTLGHIPGPCDCPEVATNSDTEVLVRWRPPIIDGGYPIQCYHLQKKSQGETEWETVHDHINHEFYLVRGLQEDTIYQFRLAAKNLKGWGEFSVSTPAVRTAPRGVLKVKMSKSMQHLQQLTESGKTPADLERRAIDYTKEEEPVKLKIGDNAQLQVRKYQLIAELSRGRYSVIVKCVRSDDKRHFAAKLIENKDREEAVKLEHEALRSLRHDRIAQLYESYSLGGVTMFVMEPLTGIDVLTYLASKHEYSEQDVAIVVLQVLSALSYLHWRGFGYLDLQPDNVVMTTCRRTDVKLVDMGSAMLVSRLGSSVPVNGLLDYIAPEVLSDHKAYPTSDVWSLGVLTYALMAGSSAFKGADDDDTRQNIQYCRYRFEHLSSSTTQEAIRFLMLIFKRDPSKRPTVDDCRDHRWLLETDYMAKKRERATFFGIKLRDYDEAYHKTRASSAAKSRTLLGFNDMNLPEQYSYDPDMFCVL